MDAPVHPSDAGDTGDTDARLLTDNYQHLRQTVASLARAAVATAAAGPSADSSCRDVTATPAGGLLPAPVHIDAAVAALSRPGQQDYLQPRGARSTLAHIVDTVVPALNGQNYGSGRYFGFVTGGTLPVAEAADNVVSALDQNVCLYLPHESVAAAVEAAALQMLADVLQLPSAWSGRLLTTGATASNVIGLALGREAVLRWRLQKRKQQPSQTAEPSGNDNDSDNFSTANLGLVEACRRAGVRDIRILTSMAHSSLYKAASVVGLGRRAVVDLPFSDAEPWRLDLDAVERELAAGVGGDNDAVLHIVSVSAGEVNTGRFATTGRADMERLRALADQYGAWIHVDAAMGLYARALPDTPEFARLRSFADGLELADSITTDGHKLLNVPYDTGIFFSRHLTLQNEVFQNANAAYLGSAAPVNSSAPASSVDITAAIPSPGNHGIENSRRFRALPVYAVLLSEGRQGIADMLVRMVRLARGIRRWIAASAAYETFDQESATGEDDTHIGVLFWATDDVLNRSLAARINATGLMYVSGTVWKGRPASRVAVSSWRVDVEQDLAVVVAALAAIADGQ